MENINDETRSQREKKICLCMIVKNESRIIERCLNAAKPIIDFVSICDTGSTDKTPEFIENWCKEHHIPYTVHHNIFINFGYNRTLSARLAQETYPQSDYLLMLDADMILQVEPSFDKSLLVLDHYLTVQYDSQIKYWLTRLLKTSLPWHSVGVTHEYWDLDRECLTKEGQTCIETKAKLDGLVINDLLDGGSKFNKFERDKRLLEEGISDPSTPHYLKTRYLFYLAQTYFCLNEWEKSIEWYQKRIDASGWVEEVFYSILQIGLCYERLAKQESFQQNLNQSTEDFSLSNEEQYFALALAYFQNAWEYRPVRAEPLYHLARLFREKSRHHLSLLYAQKGKQISFPKEDILFVDYHVYDYLFDYEISISANYIESEYSKGKSALEFLLDKIDQLPEVIARSVENNAKFYKS